MDLTPFLIIAGVAIFALLLRGAVDWWAGPEKEPNETDVTVGQQRQEKLKDTDLC